MDSASDASRVDRDGAAVRFPPPLVPLIALAVGVAVHAYIWPARLPFQGIARYGIAAVLVALGAGLMGSWAADRWYRSQAP